MLSFVFTLVFRVSKSDKLNCHDRQAVTSLKKYIKKGKIIMTRPLLIG